MNIHQRRLADDKSIRLNAKAQESIWHQQNKHTYCRDFQNTKQLQHRCNRYL